MTSPTAARYAVDAGGTHTVVAAWDGTIWRGPTVNPSSTGPQAAAEQLRAVFALIGAHAGGRAVKVWLASAFLDADPAAEALTLVAGAARAAELVGEMLACNDVTALLLSRPTGAGHVVAVCGTGSGFVARGAGKPVRVGGCEYLASDEGSAVDLGLRGLRAAVRGRDGRGPATSLGDWFARDHEVTVETLARLLAAAAFPKSAVAALAPIVMRAWQAGDEVAGRVVDAAVDELVLGVQAARDRAELAAGWALSAAGGVFTGCPQFYAEFARRAGELGVDDLRLVEEPACAVLAGLEQDTWLAARDEVWHLRLDPGGGR